MDAYPSLIWKPPHRRGTTTRWSVHLFLCLTLLFSLALTLVPTSAHAQSIQIRRERRITREPLPIYQFTPKSQLSAANGLGLPQLSTNRVLVPSRVPRPATFTTAAPPSRQR